MHTPVATQRQRAARAIENERADQRAAASRSGAAISIRQAAITRGLAPASAISTFVTEPVVPQETAASPMRPRPRSRAGLDGADTAADHNAPSTIHGKGDVA